MTVCLINLLIFSRLAILFSRGNNATIFDEPHAFQQIDKPIHQFQRKTTQSVTGRLVMSSPNLRRVSQWVWDASEGKGLELSN
jgi:hypothetical protein